MKLNAALIQRTTDKVFLQRKCKELKAKADTSEKVTRMKIRALKSENHNQVVTLKETIKEKERLSSFHLQTRQEQNKNL